MIDSHMYYNMYVTQAALQLIPEQLIPKQLIPGQLIPKQLIPIRYPKENGILYSVLFWIMNRDQLLGISCSGISL